MQQLKNVTRRQKIDRQTKPDLARVKDAITIDYSIGPLERAKRAMDQKWGFDRLPEIVPPAMAQKFGRAMEAFEQELLKDTPDAAKVVALTENLCRGLAALDAEAERLGRERAPSNTFHLQVNGKPAVIMADRATRTEAETLWPDAAIYSLDEIERILEARGMELVHEAKRVFAGAEVKEVRKPTKLERELDDDIPF